MKTLLLVEDSCDLAQVIARELENAGFEVLQARDGVAALQLHARHQPDAVILDWMLPGLDGLEVLRRIRQASPTPVLMLTARDEEIDRVMGLEVGADDYLTKPFSMRELVARVRALLRRSELIRQMLQADRDGPLTLISRGRLALDPSAHTVTLDGEPIELSRTEFDLLHLMLRNAGRTFRGLICSIPCGVRPTLAATVRWTTPLCGCGGNWGRWPRRLRRSGESATDGA